MNWQAFRLRALWCWHQLLTLALAALVVVAVMVGVSRQLFPLANHYRPDVEKALSQRLGVPVTLQRLEGDGDGLQVLLRLLQLELRDPAAPEKVLLAIPEVELRPAIWQSLRHAELRLDVRMRGLDIHLDQQPDGRLQLRELAGLARRDSATAARTVSFVLRQPALALTESRIGLALQDFPEISLGGVSFVNRNDGNHHRLHGKVRLAGIADELALQLELEGDPLYWQRGHLRAWIHLPVLDWESWLPALPDNGLGISRLRGGGNYWLEFSSGRLLRLQAEVDWRDVVLQGNHGRHHLRDMQGQLSWHRHAEGWHLAAQQLQGVVDDLAWPLPQLALRRTGDRLALALARANLTNTGKLLGSLELPETVATWLREAAPAGEVVSLRADLDGNAGTDWKLRRLDAETRWLNVQATARTLGSRNLAGWLRWTPDEAWLGLHSRAAEVHVPNFLREPVAAQELNGHFRLRRDGTGWRVDSDRLQLKNRDVQAAGVLSLALPAGEIPRLSALASMSGARAASAWRYVPWHSASDATLDWLRHSLLGGTVRRGELAYEGPVHGSEADPGRLLMHFDLERGRFDYAPGWPELRELDAAVTIDGRRLVVAASRARLLGGSEGRNIHAEIPDLRTPVLQLSAPLASTGPDLMRLLRDSPLRTRVPGLAEVVSLEGALTGQLDLRLPLRGGAADVNAVAQLRDNVLVLPSARLTATGLQGEVRYSTAAGLQAPQLDARLLEAPVQAAIQTQMGRRQEVVVNVAGTAGIPALRRWWGSNLLDVASGSTPYQARVSIPAGAAPRLQVDSSLVGVRLSLPAPLGKAAKDNVPLRYQTVLGGKEQMARLQYGQRLVGGLVWQGNRLDRALLRLDSTTPAWPQQRGIEIEGRLARLDIGEWKPWLERFRRPEASATVAARGETPLPGLTRLSLETRDLSAEGWRMRNARLGLQRDTAAWRLAVDSDELSGRVHLPDDASRDISIDLARLQWPLPSAAGKPKAAGLNPVAGLGNRPLVVKGEGLRLAAWPNLGVLGVNARLLPSPYGMRIENIELRSVLVDFSGRLDWQWRGGVSTRLRGKAGSANVAGLLAAFGFAPNLVSRRASADFDLAWRGAPDSPAPGALEGQLGITLEEGRLLNVSTGASVSRVFGWFDLDNLRRRFKGDFSDVLKRGLAFDRISLSGPLQAGIMQPAVFQVTGPTLQANGQGRLDLAQKKMDQHFIVTIPVSSAVPIAAVVVAGPVVGGAVAAAQKAFRKQINRATELHYHISGDWNNPKVERLGSASVATSDKPAPYGALAKEAE
jgi:uncharacterized protein (TIGR02099 family)